MQYREIVAVTGLSGLFQLVATKSDGAIVRSLADNTTRFIPSRLHNVTPLESIEIYTTGNNVRLHNVLQKMKEADNPKPDAKKGSADEILRYFKGVFPEMDEDRVYASDMKKMLKWYEILHGADLLDFSSMKAAEAGTDEHTAAAGDSASVTEDVPGIAGHTEDATDEDVAAMPAEGDAQVSEHEKSGDTVVPLVEEGDDKPAKKTRTRKSAATEEGDTEKPAKKTGVKKKATDTDEGDDASKKTAKPKKTDTE